MPNCRLKPFFFPHKQHDRTVSSRSAEILLVPSTPVSFEDEGELSAQAVIRAQAAASLLICLHLRPGAAAMIRSRERSREASSAKSGRSGLCPSQN